MPKISQSLSFTFRVGGPQTNQYSKVNLEISEIDTSLPIAPQLEEAKEAQKELWNFIWGEVDNQIDQIVGKKD